MGAWGSGIFDDDTACDYIYEVNSSDNPIETFRNAFLTAINAIYLEHEDCHAVTVSASYIDSILNGTRPRGDDADDEFNRFVDDNRKLNIAELKPEAVKALEKVISDGSELNELWLENEELYLNWRGSIELLINRLK